MDFQSLFGNQAPILDPTDYQGATLAAAKQRKLADMLRQQAQNNPPSGPQMVGGQYIKPDISGALHSALAQYAGMKADQADQFALESQLAAGNKWRASIPTASEQETPLVQGGMGPGAPTMVPPTRDAILKYTLAGMNNPNTAKESAIVNTSLTSDLARGEDKTFKAQQSRQTAQERSDNLMATLAQRAEDARVRSEDRSADRASREVAAAEALALRRELANGQQAIQQQGLELRRELGQGKQLKPLPAGPSSAYLTNKTGIANIEDALAKAEASAGSFGLKGMLPNAVLTRTDPKGVEARAAIANIGSLKIHDRSGAAVTESEAERLKPFIPTSSDDLPTIRKKLANFKREFVLMQQNLEDYAGSQGYHSPSGGAGGASGAVDFMSLPK